MQEITTRNFNQYLNKLHSDKGLTRIEAAYLAFYVYSNHLERHYPSLVNELNIEYYRSNKVITRDSIDLIQLAKLVQCIDSNLMRCETMNGKLSQVDQISDSRIQAMQQRMKLLDAGIIHKFSRWTAFAEFINDGKRTTYRTTIEDIKQYSKNPIEKAFELICKIYEL